MKGSMVNLKPSDVLHIPSLGFHGLWDIHRLQWRRMRLIWPSPVKSMVQSFLRMVPPQAVSWSIREM